MCCFLPLWAALTSDDICSSLCSFNFYFSVNIGCRWENLLNKSFLLQWLMICLLFADSFLDSKIDVIWRIWHLVLFLLVAFSLLYLFGFGFLHERLSQDNSVKEQRKLSYNLRNLGSRLKTNMWNCFLSVLVQSSLEELNTTHFHVTPFVYCFQGRGQCPALLLRVPVELF